MFRELNLLPSSGGGLSLEWQFLFIYLFIILVVLPWPGIEPANFFVRQFFGLLVRNANHRPREAVVLTTNPHLKTGVESTPESLCEKHFRQWILSNKFMLQIKHQCHKPLEHHFNIYCPYNKKLSQILCYHRHQSVLPKGRTFTACAGT